MRFSCGGGGTYFFCINVCNCSDFFSFIYIYIVIIIRMQQIMFFSIHFSLYRNNSRQNVRSILELNFQGYTRPAFPI